MTDKDEILERIADLTNEDLDAIAVCEQCSPKVRFKTVESLTVHELEKHPTPDDDNYPKGEPTTIITLPQK